jgi:hypothetical protein
MDLKVATDHGYTCTISQKRLKIQALRCNGDTAMVHVYVPWYVLEYVWRTMVVPMVPNGTMVRTTCTLPWLYVVRAAHIAVELEPYQGSIP